MLPSTLDLLPSPSTWNPRPSTLDKKIDSEMSYEFSFTFFSLPLIFTLHWWPLTFPILSPPLQNFPVVLPTKKCLLCFLSPALDLCRPFSRRALLVCRLLSLFLCLSPALYSKFVDILINLS